MPLRLRRCWWLRWTGPLQALATKDSAVVGYPTSNAFRHWLASNGAPTPASMTNAVQRLQQLAAAWHEVDPSDEIRETAARFLRVHPLRDADALQLAAAFVAAERRPASLEILTLDDRLAHAARKEGFTVLD